MTTTSQHDWAIIARPIKRVRISFTMTFKGERPEIFLDYLVLFPGNEKVTNGKILSQITSGFTEKPKITNFKINSIQ